MRHIVSKTAVTCLLLLGAATQAFSAPADTASKPSFTRFFIGNSLDGGIFSLASITRRAVTSTQQTEDVRGKLRFTYFFNFGFTFNYNLNQHLGVYTGLDVKNVGYIDEVGGVTIKRRTYNVGVPVGIKIGNMARKKSYMFLGAGIDAPFNYKEKQYAERGKKTKFNEWMSDRTPRIMPYVFAGYARKRIALKLQYYPNNYMNPDFTNSNGTMPYYKDNVQLFLISFGYTTPMGKKRDMMKKQIKTLNENK